MGRARLWSAVVLAAAVLAAGGGAGPAAAGAEGGDAGRIVVKGILLPEAQLQLPARVAGLVVKVAKLEGDRVDSGEPVVLLDDSDQRILVSLAQNDVETAELNLKKLKSGARAEDIERAEAFLQEGQAGLELAERTLHADMELFQGGILSELSRRRSERALEAARAVCEARRLDLVIMKKGARAEDLRLLEIELERQKSRLAQRMSEMERTRIGGSRTGPALVSRVHVEEGQWVESGRIVAELVYVDRLRMEVDLPGPVAERIARGARAAVGSARLPDLQLPGEVTRVSPVIDPASGTVRVVVEAANPDHRLRAGELATVEILP